MQPFLGLFGATLSEPHTSESNSAPACIYIYVWYVRLTESEYKILYLLITHYICKEHYVIRFMAAGSLQIGQGTVIFYVLSVTAVHEEISPTII